jgi:hypothetical protein
VSAYGRVRTRVEDGRDGDSAWSIGPDDLWECPSCSAVVKDREKHDGWHMTADNNIL